MCELLVPYIYYFCRERVLTNLFSICTAEASTFIRKLGLLWKRELLSNSSYLNKKENCCNKSIASPIQQISSNNLYLVELREFARMQKCKQPYHKFWESFNLTSQYQEKDILGAWIFREERRKKERFLEVFCLKISKDCSLTSEYKSLLN